MSSPANKDKKPKKNIAAGKILRLAAGFIILLAIQILSEKIFHLLHINFPPTIFGMIVFALLLNFKIIPEYLVKEACSFAISILPALFVPLLVGISVYYSLIKQNLLAILSIIILATFITMVLTALFVDKVMEWTGKKDA